MGRPQTLDNQGKHLDNRVKQAALDLLTQGISVIPIRPAGKQPLVAWKEYQTRLATKDEVERWFERQPDAQLAVVYGPISRRVLIDADAKNDGESNLRSWLEENGLSLPETLVYRTAGGGKHYVFECSTEVAAKIRSKTGESALTKGVDTRGEGGYGLVPPSSGYVVEVDAEPAELPMSLADAIIRVQSRRLVEAPRTENDAEWERLYRNPPTVEEGTRNDSATKVAGGLLRNNSESVAWTSLQRWNINLPEPLSESELRATFDSIAKAEREKHKLKDDKWSRVRIRSFEEIKTSPLPAPKMLVRRLVLADDICVIAGPPYAGKSLLALDLSLSIAAGIPVLGHSEFRVSTPGPVIYFYAEQSELGWEYRLRQIAAFRGVYEKPLPVSFVSAYEVKLIDATDRDEICRIIEQHKAVAAIFDPLAYMSGMSGVDSENSSSEVIKACRAPLQEIRLRTGAATIALHHATKRYLTHEPYNALELVRGSGDLIAMTGSILGVWYDTAKGITKLLTAGRVPSPPPALKIESHTPPTLPGPATLADLADLTEGLGCRPLAYAGIWEDEATTGPGQMIAFVLQHEGQVSRKEIAEELKVDPATVSRWGKAKTVRAVLDSMKIGKEAFWTKRHSGEDEEEVA